LAEAGVELGERVLIVWTIPEREDFAGQWGRVSRSVAMAGGGSTELIELDNGRAIYGCECFIVPAASAEAAESVGVDVATMVERARPTYARQAMSKHQYVPPAKTSDQGR
jgi:hypothetical protein